MAGETIGAASGVRVVRETHGLEKAQTLKPDEVYALPAFLLFKNGVIKEDDVMNEQTLSDKVEVP